jgi:Right handed beta helix region
MRHTRQARRMLVILAIAVLVSLTGQGAMAKTVVVGTCKSGLLQYPSIQAAVSAVFPGSKVEVCPGIYYEQVLITQSLTLTGVQAGTADYAVVMPPPSGLVNNLTAANGVPFVAQIGVSGAAAVNISNLTVDGSNNLLPDCSAIFAGIVYRNATGTVSHVVTQNQIESTDQTCFDGSGLWVENDPGVATSNVTIENSSVHDFQGDGIVAHNPGTTVTVTENAIADTGVTTGFVHNGIEIINGAAGTASGNSVTDLTLTNGTITSTGILVGFASPPGSPSNIKVTGNSVGDTTGAIASALGDGIVITSNAIYSSLTGFGVAGIYICSNNNTVSANKLNFSNPAGVFLDNSCGSTTVGNVVTSNTINEGCAGILVTPGVSGNTVSPNTFFNVGNTQLSGTTCTPTLAPTRLIIKRPNPLPAPDRPGEFPLGRAGR